MVKNEREALVNPFWFLNHVLGTLVNKGVKEVHFIHFVVSIVGLAYYQGKDKDIVFRFIIEYSSLMDFGP